MAEEDSRIVGASPCKVQSQAASNSFLKHFLSRKKDKRGAGAPFRHMFPLA